MILGGQGGAGNDGVEQSGQKVGRGGFGVFMGADSTITNTWSISGGAGGTASGSASAGYGGDGVGADGGSIDNLGVIIGGAGGSGGAGHAGSGYGISMAGEGAITNGGASNHSAIIEGRSSSFGAQYSGVGVFADSGSTVTVVNYGTVSGGTAVLFKSASDLLSAEAGAVFSGAVLGGGGTLELGGGSGTVSGIDSSGDVTVTGFLGSAPVFQDFGSLEVAAGGNFALAATATIASGKTLIDNGAVSDSGALSVAGSLGGSGTLSVAGKLTLQNKSALSVADLFVSGKQAKVTVGSNITFAGLWQQTDGALTINAGKTLDLTGAGDNIAGKGVTIGGELEVAGAGRPSRLARTGGQQRPHGRQWRDLDPGVQRGAVGIGLGADRRRHAGCVRRFQ